MTTNKKRIPVFSRKFSSMNFGFDNTSNEFFVKCNKGEEFGPFDSLEDANKFARKHRIDTGHKVMVETSQSE